MNQPAISDKRLTDKVKGRLQRRFLEYLRTNRGPLSPPLRLHYRKIYVLPTRLGLAFAILLGLITLSSLNFNNNLGLMLGFLLAGITVISAYQAYRNLAELKVSALVCTDAFAGDDTLVRFWLEDDTRQQRSAIQVVCNGPADCVDVKAEQRSRAEYRISTQQRGWLEIPPFKLQTTFPFGFFRAWSWVIPQQQTLVYAKPDPAPPPLPRGGRGAGEQPATNSGETLHSLRKYQTGDPLRQIAWKASARQDQLYTKQLAQPIGEQYLLDWNQMQHYPVEQRIAILTAWVVQADQLNAEYALQLPNRDLPLAAGTEHRRDCLKALALL